jgi:hypothetical protein
MEETVMTFWMAVPVLIIWTEALAKINSMAVQIVIIYSGSRVTTRFLVRALMIKSKAALATI